MQGTVLAETEAFIAKQREALLNERQEMVNRQRALQAQLDELDGMLAKFDVFEGKAAQQAPTRRNRSGQRGSRREELLRIINQSHGLSRGEILDKMGLKGNKSGEMSVSNALTALTKSKQVTRRDRKYVASWARPRPPMPPDSAVYRLGRKTRWDPYDNQRRRCRRKSMPKTISASFIFTSATRISGLAITRGPTFRFAKR